MPKQHNRNRQKTSTHHPYGFPPIDPSSERRKALIRDSQETIAEADRIIQESRKYCEEAQRIIEETREDIAETYVFLKLSAEKLERIKKERRISIQKTLRLLVELNTPREEIPRGELRMWM